MIGDPLGDGQNNGREIIGDATHAAVYLFSDGTDFFFRLRVDSNPTGSGSMRPYGWGILFDLDGNFQAYEHALMIDGISDVIELSQNTSPTNVGDPSDSAELLLWSQVINMAAGGNVRVTAADTTFNGTADYFVDVAIPVTTLDTAGIQEPFRLLAGTSNNARSISVDLSGTGSSPGPGTIASAISDPTMRDGTVTTDADGDGTSSGTDPDDANPCTPSTTVAACDADGDGSAGNVDPDNSNPCTPSTTVAACDLDGDGSAGNVDPDNSNACTPSILVAACDLDGDGSAGNVDPDNSNACTPSILVAACDLDGDGSPGNIDPD
ncbi:hypothetical protein L6R52_28310, partial [Myxococcota bacterium]|nr:hypothetical protein [Myxococcota bacterium]